MKPTNIDSVLAEVLVALETGTDSVALIKRYPEYETEIQDFLLFQSFVSSQTTDIQPSKKGLKTALEFLPSVSNASLRRELTWKRLILAFKVFTPVLAMSFLVVVSLGNISHDSNMRVAQIQAEQSLQMELQRYQQDQVDFEALQEKFFMPKQSQNESALIAQNSDYNS